MEALIGSNKKRKLRGWEEKELELSMESLGADGEDPAAHCLDMDPGQSVCQSRQSVSPSVCQLDVFSPRKKRGRLLFCEWGPQSDAERREAPVEPWIAELGSAQLHGLSPRSRYRRLSVLIVR